MMRVRYFAAVLIGVGVAVSCWFLIATAHPIFHGYQPSALIPPVLAGLLGGMAAALLAPRHKVVIAVLCGVLIAGPFLGWLLRNGFSHFGRDPVYWYWPVWLIPAFALGGFMMRARA